VEGATKSTVEYVVDGLGRRVARRLNGNFDRAWLYRDSLRPVSEVDSAGVFTHFVYASNAEESGAPIALIRAGVFYRVVKDHLGSVRLVVNATTGEVAQSIDYDAYGRVIRETGAGFQPFGFAGGLYDSTTKLVRFGARDYDPSTGRWTNKDPIGFAGQQGNVYLYVNGDPVNGWDPHGLESFECKKPLNALGGTEDPANSRNGPDLPFNPFYHQFICVTRDGVTTCGGQGGAGHLYGPGVPTNDHYNVYRCEHAYDDDVCLDNCLVAAIKSPERPWYGWLGPGTSCQEWADDTMNRCIKKCSEPLKAGPDTGAHGSGAT
jgi:RHS repeat-associated protein